MPINFNALKSQLEGIVKKLPTAELEAVATKAGTQLKGAVSTNAGSDLNADIKGIKSISVTADFAELEKLAESLEATLKPIAEQLEKDLAPIAQDIEKQINTTPTPGLLKANVPGVSSKLNKTVSSTSNLSTLTGKTVASTGFLKANVTATSPEGIRETLSGIGENIKADELETAMKEVLTPEVQQELTAAGSSVFEVTKKSASGVLETIQSGDLSKTLTKVNKSSEEISKSGAIGKLQGIMENIGGGISGPIKGITSKVNPQQLKSVVGNVSAGNVNEAANTLKAADPNINLSDTVTQLKTVDTTVAGQTTSPAPETNVLPEPTVVGDPSVKFSYITSEEELELELANITREITEVIIDWTSLPLYRSNGKPYTAQNIEYAHRQGGADEIKSHYFISPSGGIQRGRNIEKETRDFLISGPDHSSYSIYIQLSGGMISQDPLTLGDNFTPEQYDSLIRFLKKFYQIYPNGQVFGRDEIDVGDEQARLTIASYGINIFPQGPRFSVSDLILNKFNKTNVLDPSQPSKSSSELLVLARGI